MATVRYIVFPRDCNDETPLGGKARALLALGRAGLPVPGWCVVLPAAFGANLTPAQARARAESIAALHAEITPDVAVSEELAQAAARLCADGTLLAVRSSALDEDGARHSFAGQLDSYLCVALPQLAARVADVWRSGFSARLVAYRAEHGLPFPAAPPAVLLQRMAPAEAAGVAFSADPVSGQRGVAVVSAVFGFGTALVSGESDADTWRLGRAGTIIDRHIAHKLVAHRAAPGTPEGIAAEPVPEAMREEPAVTDEQAREIARLVRQAEAHFGCPQDLEWAVAGGRVYVLQSRPITTLTALADPDGELNLWDNSNIAESYNGVTTPLTFSFARRIYEHVYRQLMLLLGVPPEKVAAHDDTFRRMLGLIQGRVYYNLLSWYRVLALMPGFTVNRRFMERMMGVKEGLPEELAQRIARATWGERFRDGVQLTGVAFRLFSSIASLPKRIARFYQRLDDALAPPDPPLALLRPDELAAAYRELEQKLLTRWDAPLVNDLFAMIFFGLLCQLTEKWCGDADGTLQNDLLSGQGGIISAEPALRLREMAALLAGDGAFAALLREAPLDEILPALPAHPEFHARYQEYLARFGDRCLEELKLESSTLHDDPLLLLRSVGQLAQRGSEVTQPEGDSLMAAEARAHQALGWNPWRKLLFKWVLHHARARVRDRENLRFERTRLFGRVRRIFLELGKRLYAADMLDAPRDVFYLEVEEALGAVQGTATCPDLRALVTARKAEFDRYRAQPAPADRFATHGMVYRGNPFTSVTAAPAERAGDERKGMGCCPGIVRGRARVITDPRDALLEPGAILVTKRTDPGWILLFPAAAGVLVERGSLLSHSAIVARELRIPAIVAIPGLTGWLRDGDTVEFDGSTGVVRRLEAADGQ